MTGAIGPSYLLTSDQQALDWSPLSVQDRGTLVSNSWARVDTDGRTLSYTSHADSELCTYLHSVDVVETAGSVAVLPRLEYLPGGWRHESLAAEQRTVTVVLSRPLGGRVLVDWHGGPVVVTPAVRARGKTGRKVTPCSPITTRAGRPNSKLQLGI